MYSVYPSAHPVIAQPSRGRSKLRFSAAAGIMAENFGAVSPCAMLLRDSVIAQPSRGRSNLRFSPAAGIMASRRQSADFSRGQRADHNAIRYGELQFIIVNYEL